MVNFLLHQLVVLEECASYFISVGFSFIQLEVTFMKETKRHTTWESLPDTLTAQHISEFLAISRKTVYELLKVNVEQGGIPFFHIGASKRVDKKDLKHWIDKVKGNNSK
jgi:excisionase family DNA binding protein